MGTYYFLKINEAHKVCRLKKNGCMFNYIAISQCDASLILFLLLPATRASHNKTMMYAWNFQQAL